MFLTADLKQQITYMALISKGETVNVLHLKQKHMKRIACKVILAKFQYRNKGKTYVVENIHLWSVRCFSVHEHNLKGESVSAVYILLNHDSVF